MSVFRSKICSSFYSVPFELTIEKRTRRLIFLSCVQIETFTTKAATFAEKKVTLDSVLLVKGCIYCDIHVSKVISLSSILLVSYSRD